MQCETLALTMNLSFEFTRTRRQEMIMNLIDKNQNKTSEKLLLYLTTYTKRGKQI